MGILRGRKITYLLELKQLCCLHEVLQLEGAFGHVMGLAPLLNPRDVVLYLHS